MIQEEKYLEQLKENWKAREIKKERVITIRIKIIDDKDCIEIQQEK